MWRLAFYLLNFTQDVELNNKNVELSILFEKKGIILQSIIIKHHVKSIESWTFPFAFYN